MCPCELLPSGTRHSPQERLAGGADSRGKICWLRLWHNRDHNATPFASAKCSHLGQKGSSAGRTLTSWECTSCINAPSEDESARRRFACSNASSPSRDRAAFSSNTSDVNQLSTLPYYMNSICCS